MPRTYHRTQPEKPPCTYFDLPREYAIATATAATMCPTAHATRSPVSDIPAATHAAPTSTGPPHHTLPIATHTPRLSAEQ